MKMMILLPGPAAPSNDDPDRPNPETDKFMAGLVPPMETFATDSMPAAKRLEDVFDMLSVGDLVYCKITALNASGLLMNVNCFVNMNISPDCRRPMQRKAR